MKNDTQMSEEPYYYGGVTLDREKTVHCNSNCDFDHRLVRNVTVRVLVFQIEKMEKGSSEITLVFKGPPPKEIRTDTQTIQVQP